MGMYVENPTLIFTNIMTFTLSTPPSKPSSSSSSITRVMGLLKIFSISSFLHFLTSTFIALAHAATFNIQNLCPYTVWAAAVPVGGDRRLKRGQSWSINVDPSTVGRIWARTACNFDGAGNGRCQTGDCDGRLVCQAFGPPPNTLAEFAVNQFNHLNFFDMSLVDGFNVPMAFNPTSNGCSRGIRCTADVVGQCPNVHRAPCGCNNPCTVFKTDDYCCNSGSCGPTDYSRYFKARCPDAYSYPKADQTSTFTCPGCTNYDVIFCPGDTNYDNQTHPPSASLCIHPILIF